MTIAATELTRFGIVMTVDGYISGLTYPSSGGAMSITVDVRMHLQRIPYLRAAVSTWGARTLVRDSGEKVLVDAWLNELIPKNMSISTLREWSEMLVNELHSNAFSQASTLGFHLAGYDDLNNEANIPTFFHITNQRDRLEDPIPQGFVLLHEALPPTSMNKAMVFWNGGFNPFAEETDAIDRFEGALEASLGQSGEERSLAARCARLASWVKLVSALKATYDEHPTVPAKVMWLGITPEGVVISSEQSEGR